MNLNIAQLAHDTGDERIDVIADINSLIVWRASPDGTPLQPCGVSDVLPPGSAHHSETWLEAVHPDDREKVRPVWRKAIGSGTVFQAFYRLCHPDGSFRWSYGCGVPLLNDDGSVREWIGTIADIDDKFKAESALARSQERLRAALADSRVGIWDCDVASGEVWCSDATADIIGLPANRSMSDAEAWSAVHPDDRSWLRERVDAAFSATGNGRLDAEFRLVHASTGAALWVACSAQVRAACAGRPVRVLGTLRDISAWREEP